MLQFLYRSVELARCEYYNYMNKPNYTDVKLRLAVRLTSKSGTVSNSLMEYIVRCCPCEATNRCSLVNPGPYLSKVNLMRERLVIYNKEQTE